LSLSAEYDRWHHDRAVPSDPGRSDENSPWHRLVLEHLIPIHDKRILEIACGRGGFTQLLASLGGRVVGSDFSRAALGTTQQRIAANERGSVSVDLTQADAQIMPFSDAAFDVIISCETIEHLPHPLAALLEMARVCRPDGLLYLTTPNYFNLMGLYRVYDAMLGRPRRSEESQPLDTVWTFTEVRRLVRQAGWEILRTDGTVHQFPIPGRSPVTICFIDKNRILRRRLSVFALHQFLMARKRAA
jgi:2-polyprenyl-3-methyl-5-hydroxy-6-metoxy-1,4-benzoquinol methylase